MYKKLKEIAEYIDDGDWIESKDQSKNGIWLIQTGNIGQNIMKLKSENKHYISEETFVKLHCKEVKVGDILISRLPDPVGRSCIIESLTEKSITAVDCTILRIDNSLINKRFLINYLNSNEYFNIISENVTGSTRKRISRKKLENVQVPYFELSIQEKIANELDIINLSIENNNNMIIKLKELVQATFYDKFGNNTNNYKECMLKDVCKSIIRGPFGSSLKKEFFIPKTKNSYKVYEQKNAIQKNKELGTYYVDEKKYQELIRFKCEPNDIIMSCSGTIGELYQLPSDAEIGIINQALCKFSLNDSITPNYFLLFMENTIHRLNTKGSSIKNIGAISYIKNLEILLPPIEVQKDFEKYVNNIFKTIDYINKQNGKLKELYNLKTHLYFKKQVVDLLKK